MEESNESSLEYVKEKGSVLIGGADQSSREEYLNFWFEDSLYFYWRAPPRRGWSSSTEAVCRTGTTASESRLGFWADLRPEYQTRRLSDNGKSGIRQLASLHIRFMNMINFLLGRRPRNPTDSGEFGDSSASTDTYGPLNSSESRTISEKSKNVSVGRRGSGRRLCRMTIIGRSSVVHYPEHVLVRQQFTPCFYILCERKVAAHLEKPVLMKSPLQNAVGQKDIDLTKKNCYISKLSYSCPSLNFKPPEVRQMYCAAPYRSIPINKLSNQTDSTARSRSHKFFSLFNFLNRKRANSGESGVLEVPYMTKNDRNFWDWKNQVFVENFKSSFAEMEPRDIGNDVSTDARTVDEQLLKKDVGNRPTVVDGETNGSRYRSSSVESLYVLLPDGEVARVSSSTSGDEIHKKIKESFRKAETEPHPKVSRRKSRFSSREKAYIKNSLTK